MRQLRGRKRTIDGHVKNVANQDPMIVIAIDFGTTFSGIAYSYTSDPDEQIPIINWPDTDSGDLEGETRDKAPTVLRYMSGRTEWGFQIPSLKPCYKWFKLDIDPESKHKIHEITATLIKANAPLLDEAITAEKKVTDYLTALCLHTEKMLEHRISSNALESTPRRYILTVPAVWREKEQATLRSCALKAGIGVEGTLQMIAEPEAAAVFALKTMRHAGWNVGDIFVVVDAGGGTVDLISYKITQLSPVLRISEAAAGTGDFCGSVFLDVYFQEHLSSILGSEPGWDEETQETATECFATQIKTRFAGSSTEENFKVLVPGLADNPSKAVNRGKYLLSAHTVTMIFERVVKDIIALVLQQIDSVKGSVSKILLVGGLGQNTYLRERIRQSVGNIEVLQPGNGNAAVARGALMRGIETIVINSGSVKVTGRVARKNYGITVNVPFKASSHDADRKYWDGAEGKDFISTLQWYVKKNSTITNRKPICLEYYRDTLVVDGHPGTLREVIYYCDTSKSEQPPLYIDETVCQLVTLEADLSRVPTDKFPTFMGKDGEMYYKVHYMIKVTFESAYIAYELFHNGKSYGSVSAQYV